jgi:CubicO group peptidase (beta-lactamase class C family)
MALTHSTGFHNFWFIEPEKKLRIHFDPGSRYSYSGKGFSLLQFAIEHGARTKRPGLDVKELTDAIFVRLGMTRTSLQWRPDFRPNLADGWNDKGEPQEHDERSNVRVAGSMDTTISDLAKFVAALVRGDGLSLAARAEMVKPSLHIGTAHQFPNFAPYLPKAEQRPDLAAGLGVIVFEGPQGRGFYKGGHDGQTANSFVCLERGRRCVLLLANDVRGRGTLRRSGALRARRNRRPLRLGVCRSSGQVLTAGARQLPGAGSRDEPQPLELPQPPIQLVPTRENTAQSEPSDVDLLANNSWHDAELR